MRVQLSRTFETLWSRMVLAVVAPLVALGLVAMLALWITALPSDAAFRANGMVTTKAELAQRVKMLGALYGIQPPEGAGQQDGFRRDAAKMVAVTSVIDHAAQERGIEVSDQEARAILDKLINGLSPPGEASFIRLLAETGASQHDVLAEITRQARSARLVEQVVGGAVARLGEADYRRYFDQHAADLATPEQRHLRNIVVRTQQQAKQVADRARAGTDFGALAQENSLDHATRDNQGDLGLVDRGQLEPGYGSAAFSAPRGAVFGPVQTSSGWNVGRVDEIHPAVPRTYDQARSQVVELVHDSCVARTWNAWLAGQVEQADVQYADDYRPADPTSAPPNLPGPPGQHVTSPHVDTQPESPR